MDPVQSSNKSPEKYDTYTSTVSEHYMAIAMKNLNETDKIRELSLASLRDLIKNDTRIISCRTDALFLLRFLRVKKFNVEEAHAMVYRHIKNRQEFPHWFRSIDVLEPRIQELLDLGALIPLRQRDEKGRQIWIYDFGKMDPDRHTSTDFIRLQEALYQICMDDEETQICGLICVFDFSNLTMRHVSICSMWDYKNLLSSIRKAIPLRVQAFYVLNLPRTLQIFYEVGAMLVSTKVRKRMRVFKSLEEFGQVVNLNGFPESFGGQENIAEIVSEFKKKMHVKRDKVMAMDEMLVQVKKTKQEKGNIMLSDRACSENSEHMTFKILEVD